MSKAALEEKYRFREQLVDALAADLVGPGGGVDEVISEPPLNRYIVGALWPRPADVNMAISTAQQRASEPEGAESDTESDEGSPVAQARMRFPSSMGMTFSVRGSVSEIVITPTAGRYEQQMNGDKPADEWKRIPLEADPIHQNIETPGKFEHQLGNELEVYCLVRRKREGAVAVTVALKNRAIAVKGELRDSKAWFQAGLAVTTDGPCIADRTAPRRALYDPDLASAALMYRNAHTFAIGHGCAVQWDLSAAQHRAIDRVETTFIPSHEVHRAKPGELDDVDLRMVTLAEADKATVVANLRDLTYGYHAWIQKVEGDIESGTADVVTELRAVARHHIEEMEQAANRIDAGIQLLENDDDAFRAFQLANRAMQMQRSRQDWIRAGHKPGELSDGSESKWRPFQIAYLLLNLPGITDPEHEDRDVADLLWFPTGGGKTEAYLGLVAYVILLRRVRDRGAFGVAVLMRYTLRLLTIQQFERASMLMCALETIRKENRDLGERKFSIGLWVGSGATPNSLKDAKTALRKLGNGEILEQNNPVQLKQCPWCGAPMDHENYQVVQRPKPGLKIACGTDGCDFGDRLPVHVVDDDVYAARPELLLGTVDKFAMMAWNENVGSLFARDEGLPPELIIQDELHLISGPLGSIVGLYETAVDAACTVRDLGDESGRSRPKVIASTATIRRASEQISAVFARGAALFPPPGIDPDPSFFAEPSTREEFGTRRYVGVMASGTSHATLLIRVYSALLQAAADIDGDDVTRDPYWTLLGYFNSLRVLGSANLQVEGDVREQLGVVAGRSKTTTRPVERISELTSRVPSSEIPGNLKQLENQLGGSGSPIDLVLAANMISVGGDTARLGVMAVMGQPQASAEYIQATSRVGRKHPGLVVTIFNSARSRDRSHYESFLPFHQAMYRAVEATSATPFAARARDRALHGVLISMVRMLVPGMMDNSSAHLAGEYCDDLTKIGRLIEQRVAAVGDDEMDATAMELGKRLDVWSTAGDQRPNMKYSNTNMDSSLMVRPAVALVNDDIAYSQDDVPWPTLQSMRDVDAESNLYQVPAGGKK